MATVEAYETESGKRYRVRYRKPDHSQTSKRGFRTKREADLFLASVESSKSDGTYLDPASARITIAELGEVWLASQSHLKPSSAAVVESAWRLHVRPTWGSVAVGHVRFSSVQSWVANLTNGAGGGKAKSPALVLRAHGVLLGILESAVRDHRIASNPARGVALPRKVGREHRYLTHAEVHRLAGASGRHAGLVRMLAYTGLRWGEATGLRVRDVDLVRRRLAVVQNAVLVRGTVVLGTPKTHKRRTVPYPAILDGELERATAGKDANDLVFAGLDGRHLITPTVRDRSWFDRALQEADLPPMTIHDLRHTAASLAVASGANVKAVQKMLGHASAAMTLDVYTDLFDDDLDAVAVRLNDAALAASVSNMWPRDDEGGPEGPPHQVERPGIPGQ